MQKSTKKIQTIFFGILLFLVVIIWGMNGWGTEGGKQAIEEAEWEANALEQTLEKIQGVGKVVIYYYDSRSQKEDPLSAYFSLSQMEEGKDSNDIKGVLIVAEGGGDLKVQNLLTKAVSTVLQLPEHQIMIVEMKKEGELE